MGIFFRRPRRMGADVGGPGGRAFGPGSARGPLDGGAGGGGVEGEGKGQPQRENDHHAARGFLAADFCPMVLTQVGLPVEGIALIIGVDRLLDMVRTSVNVTGDAMVSVLVGKSEKKINERIYTDPNADI